MNPRRIVATLLEADDLLPQETPQPSGDEQFDPSDIKDYADYSTAPRAIEGMPITGYYRGLAKKLENKRLRTVNGGGRGWKTEPNTWLLIDGDIIKIRFYWTDILTVTPDDTVTVNSGGFQTVTTQGRIGEWLPGGWNIYKQKGTWYWYNYKTRGEVGTGDFNANTANVNGMKVLQPFSDGDRITADGSLHPILPAEYVKVRKPRGNSI
jgi:hypothetical protein